MKKYLFTLLFVQILFGCKSNQGDQITVDWSGKEQALNSTELKLDTMVFLTPSKLLLYDDVFVLINPFDPENIMATYRLKGDSLLLDRIVAKRGKGPTEWLNPPEMYRVSDGRFVMLEDQTNRIMISKDNSIDALKNIADWEVFSFPRYEIAEFVDLMVPYMDNPYKMYGTMASSKYNTTGYEYNLIDTTVSPLYIDYSPHDFEMEPEFQLGMIFRSKIYNKPGTNRFIYGSLENEYIYLFEKNGDQIDIIKYLYNNPPKAQKGSQVFEYSEALENSYGFKLVTTDDYIYMLDRTNGTNGKKNDEVRNGIKGYPSNFAKSVYVYDWDGNPVKKYNLDQYVDLYYEIDEKNKCMYATTLNLDTGDPIIMRFE